MTCAEEKQLIEGRAVPGGVQDEGHQAGRARRRRVARGARFLGVTRKAPHDWVRAYKASGPEGLNRKRGPKPGRKRLKPVADVVAGEGRGALAAAQRRIAELERAIGRQPLELDFFRQALRALDGKATQGKRGPVLPKSSKR
jgi:transposase